MEENNPVKISEIVTSLPILTLNRAKEEYSVLNQSMYNQNEFVQNHLSLENYRIIKELGTGTFGKVSLCEDLLNKRRVALKELNLNLLSEQEVKTEFEIVSMYDHDRIIKVYEIFKPTNNCMVIVMEYCEGGSLREIFENYFNSNKRFPEDIIKKWIFQILDGLESLHSRRIIHRDIKLDNIMFDKEQNVKIIDFGTSKFLYKKSLTNTLKGSPMFIAPEILKQIQGQKIDGRVDVFSVGIILYILCFMKYPYISKSPLDVRNDVITDTISYKMLEFPTNSEYSKDLKFIYDRMAAIDFEKRSQCKDLLLLPYFQDSKLKNVVSISIENDKWIASTFNKIVSIFFNIPTRQLIESINFMKYYSSVLIKKKFTDSLPFFACSAILMNIFSHQCMHGEVKKISDQMQKEILPEFLEFIESEDCLFAIIYLTRKLENQLKLNEVGSEKIIKNLWKYIDPKYKMQEYGRMLCYEALSFYLYTIGDFLQSIEFIKKAIEFSKLIKEDYFVLDISHLYNIAGIVHSKNSNEFLIKDFFMKSIEIKNKYYKENKENNDTYFFGTCYFGSYINLGNFYFKSNDFENSINFYKKALDIFNNEKFKKQFNSEYQFKLLKFKKLCEIYLYSKEKGHDYLITNKLVELNNFSSYLILENEIQGIDFFNALGIYFANNFCFSRSLHSFKWALEFIYMFQIKDKIYQQIILNNIAVLNFKFGYYSFFHLENNFLYFQRPQYDLFHLKADDRKIILFINFLNFSLIKNNRHILKFSDFEILISILDGLGIDNFSNGHYTCSFPPSDISSFNLEKIIDLIIIFFIYIINMKNNENFNKNKYYFLNINKYLNFLNPFIFNKSSIDYNSRFISNMVMLLVDSRGMNLNLLIKFFELIDELYYLNRIDNRIDKIYQILLFNGLLARKNKVNIEELKTNKKLSSFVEVWKSKNFYNNITLNQFKNLIGILILNEKNMNDERKKFLINKFSETFQIPSLNDLILTFNLI